MFRSLGKLLLPFFLGLFFTALITWPFISKLSTYYYDSGDYPLCGWILWYNQFSISTGRILNQQLYFQSNQIYPLPYSLAFSEHLIVPSLIFSPIYWITKNLVLSVNLFFFLTFIFNFLSSFFVIKYFLNLIQRDFYKEEAKNDSEIKIYLASIIGSLIFTFNPLTFVHFQGHLQLMNKYFLPPLFLFAYKYFKEIKIKNAFYFYLFFTLNSLSSFYFQIFSIISLLIFFIPFIIHEINSKNFKYFLRFLKTSTIFLIFIPILIYFNLPYLEFSSHEYISRSLDENAYYSARILDWIIPNPMSFIYEKFTYSLIRLRGPLEINGNFNYSEHTLSLNIIPLSLLILTIIIFFKKENKNLRIYIFKSVIFKSFLIIFLLSALFTFGPLLFFSSESISTIKLPYFYLYETIPFLKGIRVPSRFQFIFYIPFSLFISFGLFIIIKNSKKFYLLFIMFIILGIFLENYQIRSYNNQSTVISNFNYGSKLSFLKNKNTFHLPVYLDEPENEMKYVNWSTQTEENILNGYSGYFPLDWITLKKDFILGLDLENLKKLKAINLDYLIIHKNLIDKNFLKNSQTLISTGTIFEDESVIVLDINKYNLIKYVCISNNNLILKVIPERTILTENFLNYKINYQISVYNPNNCFIGNIGLKRYLNFNLTIRNQNHSAFLRLPLVINPNEKIVLPSQIRIYSFFNNIPY